MVQDIFNQKKKNRAGRILLDFLIYFVIIGGAVFGLPRFLSWKLNTPFPMAAITSGSMWPALKISDLVFIQGVNKEDIKAGDIIVYRNKISSAFTIHRVVRIETDSITTKGDGNFKEDPPIDYEDVIGKTLTFKEKPVRIPYLGSITVFASNFKQ